MCSWAKHGVGQPPKINWLHSVKKIQKKGAVKKSRLNTVASAPGTGHKNIKKWPQPIEVAAVL